MAEESVSSTAQAAPADDGALTVNLKIISPSAGVPNSLEYPDLPATTTIGQIRERLRGELTVLNPSQVQLRLINRGRVLDADDATLLRILGAPAIQESKEQTFHLVVKGEQQEQQPAQSTARPASQTAPNDAAPRHYYQPTQPHFNPNQTPQATPPIAPNEAVPRPYYQPTNPVFDQARPPITPHEAAPRPQYQPTNPQFAPPATHTFSPALHQPASPFAPHGNMNPHMLAQQQHQTMVQWMNQLQREAAFRQVHNNQRERAAMGLNGIQDAGRNTPGTTTPIPGQVNAAPHGHTFVREGVAPNGQHWRVTVNETVVGGPTSQPANTQPGNIPGRSPVPGVGMQPGNAPVWGGGLSPMDVQNIIRNADTGQATQAITDALHRSVIGASGAPLSMSSNAHPQVGVTVPLPTGMRQNLSRTASRTATPDPGRAALANLARGQHSRRQPEVYILSSPAGPRALLINNNLETFFTPSVRHPPFQGQQPIYMPPFAPFQLPVSLPRTPMSVAQTPQPTLGGQDILEQWRQNAQQQPAQEQGQPQARQDQQDAHGQRAQLRPRGGFQPLHANNPGAGALAAIWPHVWLLVRLVLFVWWFTSPNSSWSRWATVISLAIAVFIINTGLLDGIANQAWQPFRRHLEGLLPLANPNAQRAQDAAAVVVPPAPRPAGDNAAAAPRPATEPPAQNLAPAVPNPAQTAARLVAEHRDANANWLMDQVRRVERAGLLFLASIAPGVAERHIAHLEAEARAETQRREAEQQAAAAAAAATAAAAAEETEGQESREGQNQQDGRNQRDEERAGENPVNGVDEQRRAPGEEEPLIVI